MQSTGGDIGNDFDGILGLAPQKSAVDQAKNYVWSMANNQIIKKPIMSFSMGSDQPYTLFERV